MSSVLRESVLVLNNRWSVAGFSTVEDAIVSCIRERCCLLDTRDFDILEWDRWIDYDPPSDYRWIRTTTGQIPAPEVAILRAYGERPPKKLSFSKPAVYHRDNHRCVFCGVQLPAPKLTLDHVRPRSKGGETSFTNCVAACEPCNRKKSNLSVEEAGMKLRYQPYIPDWSPKLRVPGQIKESWRDFLLKEKLL